MRGAPRLPPPVLSKAENYRLWRSGAWGTKLRSWSSYEAWRESGYGGEVALRSRRSSGGGGPCFYHLKPWQVASCLDAVARLGLPRELATIDEMAPSEKTILQGEYLNDALSPGYFLHSTRAAPMREALRFSPEVSTGLRSSLLLREAMTPSSWEDFQELLTLYPGHVVEVSVYDECVGDLPHRNALVWEVRRY